MKKILPAIVMAFVLGLGVPTLLRQLRASTPQPFPPSDSALVGPVLFKGLGDHHHPVTTASPEAQKWFDQGLAFTFGFNHFAAERSYLKAAELDPDCAMCWWGAALVLGPHINAAMDADKVPGAWQFLQRAVAMAPKASRPERAYIHALTMRYARKPPADRNPLDVAYAQAMRTVAMKYPDDLDAQTLFAEALMDLHPWDLYDKQGTAKAWTPEIVALLETVLAKDPTHLGGNHYYIHSVEASDSPERGLPSADRLMTLAPAAGHLVHMPAHIYMRVGRYHDASEATANAAEADKTYLAVCRPGPGLYPLSYVPHNYHFLWASAAMEGDSKRALWAAEETKKRVSLELMEQPGNAAYQHDWATLLYAKVRFGRWNELLAEPAPPPALSYATAVWHYAQGMALMRNGQLEEAQRHLDVLSKIVTDPEMKKLTIWNINTFAEVLQVAELVLTGELAAARKDFTAAVSTLRKGVAAETALNYDEPADWYFPARQSLGAVLLLEEKAADAQKVYENDLRWNRENGWSLFGLAQSLRAQGKEAEADATDARFKKAWSHADVKLYASRF